VTNGLPIDGLAKAQASAAAGEEVVIFHAGTRRSDDGQVVTHGGRVITVVGLAADLAAAQAVANRAAACIRFPGAFFRKDIGHRVMRDRVSR
jgi:phosphoribosylamine--glycine ligase